MYLNVAECNELIKSRTAFPVTEHSRYVLKKEYIFLYFLFLICRSDEMINTLYAYKGVFLSLHWHIIILWSMRTSLIQQYACS